MAEREDNKTEKVETERESKGECSPPTTQGDKVLSVKQRWLPGR